MQNLFVKMMFLGKKLCFETILKKWGDFNCCQIGSVWWRI